ncbi:hypothetical protein ABT58_11975 [Photobacterium aphoticum]|uniref:DUF2861 domain-containing protein n=1 Tax=Photobacterium aphoticum TaxID=754436 RepID=A0A0J1GLQ9_9GAMM|nr:hypothetical protein ABT58_11975 [Photobacterium aphoticum]
MLSLCLPVFSPPAIGQTDWFVPTPLQSTYQALLANHPEQAWQELHLALSQAPLSCKHWVPVKNAILTQTECGQTLPEQHTSPSMHTPSITLHMIRRFGITSQGYQIKISAVQSPLTDKDNHMLPVTLLSPTNHTLLSGEFSTQSPYQEIEMADLMIKPMPGRYLLTVGEHTYPLLIAMESRSQWLTLTHTPQGSQVALSLPETIEGCPAVNARWQWFDDEYNTLGKPQLMLRKTESVPRSYPLGAKHLAASVERVEFQQGVTVHYIQRINVPFHEPEPSSPSQ